MNFTKHEIKIYNNSELALYQAVELEILVCELEEIKSLLTLFSNKRLLKNTNLRLNNNINKCLALK